jgi:HEAT repeat protein
MTRHRDEVIGALASFAGPLGPLTTLEERLARQDRWVDEAGAELVGVLAGVVDSPPRLLPGPPDDWEVTLVELASRAGSAHADEAIAHFVPLLERPHARAIAVDVLGGVGDPRAVPPLGALLSRSDIDRDERLRSAGALGDIGGDEACRLLREMQGATPVDDRELHDEIAISLRTAGC